ncbi:MAG: 2-dehydropantoate 2-reductase [Syntrophus sp. (in: bacteria)]
MSDKMDGNYISKEVGPMRIAVIGIGGVGGSFGGKLASRYVSTPDHEVVFIVRGEHLKAIKRKGMTLITPAGESLVRPSLATDNPAGAGAFDLVLFAVKSYGLEQAARMVIDNIKDDTVIIPLLNGVDITERLQRVLPRGICLYGTVYVSAFIEAPGVIRQVSPASRLIFGPDGGSSERFRPIDALFQEAGIVSELTPSSQLALWTKFIFICPAAGVTSLLQKPFGEVMDDSEARDLLFGLIGEVEQIARARGIDLPGDIVPATLAKVKQFPYETKTSMQLDYEKGRETEIDIFTGYIVRTGQELGIKTPLHDRVYKTLTGAASS